MTKRCGNCLHWLAGEDGCKTGECRRRAPHPLVMVDSRTSCASAFWPIVAEDDWCGEHQPPPQNPDQLAEALALVAQLQGQVESMAARISEQSELLSRRAEK